MTTALAIAAVSLALKLAVVVLWRQAARRRGRGQYRQIVSLLRPLAGRDAY